MFIFHTTGTGTGCTPGLLWCGLLSPVALLVSKHNSQCLLLSWGIHFGTSYLTCELYLCVYLPTCQGVVGMARTCVSTRRGQSSTSDVFIDHVQLSFIASFQLIWLARDTCGPVCLHHYASIRGLGASSTMPSIDTDTLESLFSLCHVGCRCRHRGTKCTHGEQILKQANHPYV